MSDKHQQAAFPYRYEDAPGGPPYFYHGLTKREYFAGLAMQALIHPDTTLDDMDSAAIFARRAADALLAALENHDDR